MMSENVRILFVFFEALALRERKLHFGSGIVIRSLANLLWSRCDY